MNLVISDNTRVGYDVPVICVQNYTKDVIFQKKLLEDYGTVPESLKQKIHGEKDLELLKKWFKLVARTSSIKEFEEKF